MTKKFNIAAAAVALVAPMHVKNAAGEPMYADDERKLPIRIHFHGPGSKAFGVVESRQSARAVKRMQDNDGKVTVAPLEERQTEAAADLASLTASFENFDYAPAGVEEGSLTGEDLFVAVYSDPLLGFVARQASKFLADWGNFSAASKAA
jgi:hypothetical protein